MAQQTTAGDSTDPELSASTLAEAQDSLQVYMTRDEMRQACREWGLEGYSGPKAEMAAAMTEQAPEQAIAFLLEEGVSVEGDLAEIAGLAPEAEEEENEDDGGRSRTTVGEMLAQHPDEYHRDSNLGYSDQQVAVLARAMGEPDATDAEVADEVGCSPRYVNSVCHRWPADSEGVQAIEDAGHAVPERFAEVDR
jgi:hypothetical protein